MDFDKKVNYCLLNEEGRRIFIEAFESRMESVRCIEIINAERAHMVSRD